MSNFLLKKLVFSLTIVLVIFLVFPNCAVAQKNLTVLNYSFEQPDSGKIKGFDGLCSDPTWKAGGGKLIDIPGWNVDSKDKLQRDSGIEPKTTSDGKYDGYMMGGDPGIYQNLARRVYSTDQLKLRVDARNSWLGTKFLMELYYLDGDTANAPRVSIVSDTKTLTNTGTMAEYSISFKGTDFPTAVGHKLGILLDNVSPDSASWLEFDNVRIENDDPTIIEVENYSFEKPDSNKIEGWNGPGSDDKFANSSADIPGWASDAKTHDSGIDARGNFSPVEGQYIAFLMGGDTSVYNTTKYILKQNDVLTLTVAAYNNYAATTIHLEIYYQMPTGEKIPLNFEEQTLTTGLPYVDHSIQARADDDPACYGLPVGVLIDNVNTVSSWMNFDFVRLNGNNVITGVASTKAMPKEFSLSQNYPNPFNPTTKISYTLPEHSKVRLSVFDLLGREVAVLVDKEQNAGLHNVQFKAGNLSSGIYFYRLQSSNNIATKKMLLLK
jgi:Secretion system C-terminal sorting domain